MRIYCGAVLKVGEVKPSMLSVKEQQQASEGKEEGYFCAIQMTFNIYHLILAFIIGASLGKGGFYWFITRRLGIRITIYDLMRGFFKK